MGHVSLGGGGEREKEEKKIGKKRRQMMRDTVHDRMKNEIYCLFHEICSQLCTVVSAV